MNRRRGQSNIIRMQDQESRFLCYAVYILKDDLNFILFCLFVSLLFCIICYFSYLFLNLSASSSRVMWPCRRSVWSAKGHLTPYLRNVQNLPEITFTFTTVYLWVSWSTCAARRRAAKRKMKQMKSHSKEADEFEEETEDMFSEFGQFSTVVAFIHSFVV